MAPHADVFLLLACALALAASTVLCDTEQFLLSDMKKWDGARKACLQSQGKCGIAMGRTGVSKVWDSLSLLADQPHWVGARMGNILLWKDSKQPFIQLEGCYQAPHDWRSLQSESHTLNKNSPERCLSLCPTSMVALQNTTCMCLKLNILGTLSKSAQEECNILCQGDYSRCGDADNHASVYSIPERTVLEKKPKSGAWYWYLSHNNEHQFIVITNADVKMAGLLCAVSGNGSYESRGLSSGCPKGSKNVTFENMDVAAFLESVSAMNLTLKHFASPLVYFTKPVWLDGTLIPRASGTKGYCIALVRQTNGYVLTRRSCKEKLPAICACETESTDTDQHTTTQGHLTARPKKVTTQRTTQSTAGVLSTKEYSSSQSTTDDDADSTSTTTVASSTSTVLETTKGTTLHTSSHTSSQTVVTTQPQNTVTTQSYVTTKLTQPQKTVTTPPEVTTNLTQPQNSATTSPDVTATNLTSSNITHSSNDGSLSAPPMDIDAGQATARETATASTGLIAGIIAGCVLLCIVVVVAVFLFKRKQRESSQALVKRDKSGHVSYPI